MIQAGSKAPLFKAEGTQGEVDLAALLLRGPVVLYFFPKANTPG
jgi:peroxiredoxin Q/BCP